ncbi:DUF4333 domain-containing protein [Fischerella sp. JS2]|uniref:DUF4333 domain-containing protein n=1 Tax=Fischerella sp. JS2 TaxID=2597771 RepID=UPI0028E6AE15|nr:DUF4333 domain-containing protein [Fischerella sp. JS2]
MMVGCSFEFHTQAGESESGTQTASNTSNVENQQTSSSATKSKLTKKVETAVKEQLGEVIGVPIESVSCPNQVHLEVGQPFDCNTVAENKEFITRVNPSDNDGSLKFNTRKVLVLPVLEQTIETGFKDQVGVEVSASCGEGKLRTFEQLGETFDCQVTDTKGETAIAEVTVKDDTGNVNWEVKKTL